MVFCHNLAGRHRSRSGAAALELAIVLPLLALLLVIVVDFCRVFYYSVTLSNCARNGALYASDPYSALASTYTSVQAAAVADASNLNPLPNVTYGYGTSATGPFTQAAPSLDAAGNATGYVSVTVTWQFKTVTNFPGIPSPLAVPHGDHERGIPEAKDTTRIRFG